MNKGDHVKYDLGTIGGQRIAGEGIVKKVTGTRIHVLVPSADPKLNTVLNLQRACVRPA